MHDLFSVKDKIILITGAARGNGKSIAEGFHKLGSKVCMIDLLFDENDLSRNTDIFLKFSANILDKVVIKNVIDQIIDIHSKIDVLINNAGITITDTDPYDINTWNKTIDVNLNANFYMSKIVSEKMKLKNSGSIINITSLGSELGFPNNPSYQASKAALKQLTKAMAFDFGLFNIKVNNICPGYIRTNMTQKSYNDLSLREERSRRTMLNRWGESSDLLGACVFLSSDASSYITGSSIYVDGGWTAKGL